MISNPQDTKTRRQVEARGAEPSHLVRFRQSLKGICHDSQGISEIQSSRDLSARCPTGFLPNRRPRGSWVDQSIQVRLPVPIHERITSDFLFCPSSPRNRGTLSGTCDCNAAPPRRPKQRAITEAHVSAPKSRKWLHEVDSSKALPRSSEFRAKAVGRTVHGHPNDLRYWPRVVPSRRAKTRRSTSALLLK